MKKPHVWVVEVLWKDKVYYAIGMRRTKKAAATFSKAQQQINRNLKYRVAKYVRES